MYALVDKQTVSVRGVKSKLQNWLSCTSALRTLPLFHSLEGTILRVHQWVLVRDLQQYVLHFSSSLLCLHPRQLSLDPDVPEWSIKVHRNEQS